MLLILSYSHRELRLDSGISHSTSVELTAILIAIFGQKLFLANGRRISLKVIVICFPKAALKVEETQRQILGRSCQKWPHWRFLPSVSTLWSACVKRVKE